MTVKPPGGKPDPPGSTGSPSTGSPGSGSSSSGSSSSGSSSSSSSSGSSAPAESARDASLIAQAKNLYYTLWGQYPPDGYVERLVHEGLNIYEIEQLERDKAAFARTKTYRTEASSFATLLSNAGILGGSPFGPQPKWGMGKNSPANQEKKHGGGPWDGGGGGGGHGAGHHPPPPPHGGPEE